MGTYNRFTLITPLLTLALVAVCSVSFAQEDQRPHIDFILPIDCIIGETCFVQNYVDVEPSPDWTDFTCGHLSYDGHKGTDFRVLDMGHMRQGVAVLAAADGMATWVRDGEADGLYFGGEQDAVQNKACGNGILIDHGNNWITQYCHLKKGSVHAYRGQTVTAGDQIGLLGLSGQTEFPHLHFEARHNENVIDPYTGIEAKKGCRLETEPLWKTEIRLQTEYIATGLLNQGFLMEEPTMQGIEEGRYLETPLDTQAPVLIYYARIFGLQTGDVQILTVVKPDGSDLIKDSLTHAGSNKAHYFRFVGKRIAKIGWTSGMYEGRYTLIRNDRVLLNHTLALDLRPPVQ